MIPVDITKEPTPTAEQITRAVAASCEWWRVLVVPNVVMSWGEIDVAVITRNFRLWEFEIKTSQADWERDKDKYHRGIVTPPADGSWRRQQAQRERWLQTVTKFWYVYTQGLRVPTWVDEGVGLLEALHETHNGQVYLRLRQHRGAVRNKQAERISDALYRAIAMKGVRRYWNRLGLLPESDVPALLEEPADAEAVA